MLEASWLLFIVASLVVITTPGQDMILVMSRSIVQGAVAGVATAAGVFAGLLSGWLRARPRVLLNLYRGSGLVMRGPGLRLALEQRE